jgi:hypothetical protein
VLIAAASSSIKENHLIICAVEKGKKPTLRVLPWQNDQKARISALCFNASGEFLLTGAVGGGVHIVPAIHILTSKLPPQHTSLLPKCLCASGPMLVSVLWWRRSIDNTDVAISMVSQVPVCLGAHACERAVVVALHR